jgi:hypothetical protein
LLGGILAGLFCKVLVMPNVPEHYNTMLETFRQDMQSHYEKGGLNYSYLRNENTENGMSSTLAK